MQIGNFDVDSEKQFLIKFLLFDNISCFGEFYGFLLKRKV